MKLKYKIIYTMLVTFLSLVMFGGVYVYSLLDRVQIENGNNKNNNNKPIIGNQEDGSKESQYAGDEYISLEDLDLEEVDGITNILLVGMDGREKADPGGADALIILTIDNNNNKIKTSSINRDTLVELPGYGNAKITDIYRHQGMNSLMYAIGYNFGISIEDFVLIDFNGFKDIIDTIGGIELTLTDYSDVNELNRIMLDEKYEYMFFEKKTHSENYDSDFVYIVDKGRLTNKTYEYPYAPYLIDNDRITEEEYEYVAEVVGFIEKEGTFIANGQQALAYSRNREGGVEARGNRQVEVIDAVISKVLSMAPFKYVYLAEEIVNHIKTNLDKDEMLNLAFTGIGILEENNMLSMEQMHVPPEKLSYGMIVDGKFVSNNTIPDNPNDPYVILMDKYNTRIALEDFIFNDIVYNSSKYPTYNYLNDGYHGPIDDEEEEKEGEDEDSEESTGNDESLEDDGENDESETDEENDDLGNEEDEEQDENTSDDEESDDNNGESQEDDEGISDNEEDDESNSQDMDEEEGDESSNEENDGIEDEENDTSEGNENSEESQNEYNTDNTSNVEEESKDEEIEDEESVNNDLENKDEF